MIYPLKQLYYYRVSCEVVTRNSIKLPKQKHLSCKSDFFHLQIILIGQYNKATNYIAI